MSFPVKTHARWGAILAATALASTLAGCGTAEGVDDDPVHDAVAATVASLWGTDGMRPWPNGTVPVCFSGRIKTDGTLDQGVLGDPLWNSYTTTIRDLVTTTYEHVSGTRIDFTGWELCPDAYQTTPENLPGTVRIQLKVDPACPAAAFSASTGGYDPNNTRVVWTNYYSYGGPTNPQWQTALLHEFGHILGFEHEFHRTDWDSNCVKGDGTQYGDAGEREGLFFTPYDPASMMLRTYCPGNPIAWVPELSALDRVGLRVVYPDSFSHDLRAPAGAPAAYPSSWGLITHPDGILVDPWTEMGVGPDAFSYVPSYEWLDGSETVQMDERVDLDRFERDHPTRVVGEFTDWNSRDHTLFSYVVVDAGKHAAVTVGTLNAAAFL